ncbi:MAG: hypothetical protein PHS68_07730 [Candidatus Izemoplasmatales bacterium]|jgi:hypothetical protein|nr:hypothetical protein [Candidatus Izemoplasmatales bacterium]
MIEILKEVLDFGYKVWFQAAIDEMDIDFPDDVFDVKYEGIRCLDEKKVLVKYTVTSGSMFRDEIFVETKMGENILPHMLRDLENEINHLYAEKSEHDPHDDWVDRQLSEDIRR